MCNAQGMTRSAGVLGAVNCASDLMAKTAFMVAPLFLRAALALPFFKSGLTKWDGFLSLSPATNFLFQEEFKLHFLGRAYDLPAPDVLALASSSAEIILPSLLVVGLFTRFSALGLLGMTAVIQLIVPDGWANFHLPWATMAIALIALGPGRLSLDHWLWRVLERRAEAVDAGKIESGGR